MLGGCAKSHLDMDNISNVHSAKLHVSPESILVISDEQQGQLWYKLGENRKLENLDPFSGTNFHAVDQISISPNDQWIAVITVGEGHPMLDVYDLQAVLNGIENAEEKKLFTPLFIDPYPGYIQILSWTDDQLIVQSDIQLDHLDKNERRVPNAEHELVEETFIWHLPSDTITKQ